MSFPMRLWYQKGIKSKLSNGRQRNKNSHDQEVFVKSKNRSKLPSKPVINMNSDRDVKLEMDGNEKLSHKKSFSVNINSKLTKFFNEVDKPYQDKQSITSKNSSGLDDSQKEGSNPSKKISKETLNKTFNNKTASHDEEIGSLDSRKKKFINPIILKQSSSEDLDQDNIHHKNFESFSHIKPSKSQMKQFDSFFKQNNTQPEIFKKINENNVILDNEQMLQNVFKSTLESKSSYQNTQSFNDFNTNTSSKKLLQEELLQIQKTLSKQTNLIKKPWYLSNFDSNSPESSIYDILVQGIDDITSISDTKIRKFLYDMKSNFKKHWNYMKFLAKEPNQILLLKTRKSLLGTCIIF